MKTILSHTANLTLAAGLLLAATIASAQPKATVAPSGAYLIPFATEGNRIELTIANEMGTPLENVEARLLDAPDWLRIDRSAALDTGEDLDTGAEAVVVFEFAVDDDAPTEEPVSLEFELLADEELVGTKTIDIAVELPKELMLRGNYPNPFNPSTTIGFVSPNEGNVSLEIFDELGRVVETVRLDVDPGQQTFQWNAAQRASGAYFYRLQFQSSDGKSQVKLDKMLLIK